MTDFISPPYLLQKNSVTRIMAQVLAALLPAIALYVWFVGPIVLVQIAIASATALAAEAAVLALRAKPVARSLGDGSALVTAWLIALAFPPFAPWWLLVTGTVFAIVIAKQLYGGLGQNPFNPAMAAYAACIISFPALMAQWPVLGATPPLSLPFGEQLALVFGQIPRIDTMSGATPLDALKTALKLHAGEQSVDTIRALAPHTFGFAAGRGWEWITAAYLVGGLWLWRRRVITWQAPVAFLAAFLLIASAFWLWHPETYASPLFHLFAGATLLGAFFIVTDPVSGCTTPRGKLIFGAGAGMLAYLIRVFGAYPDGVAFGVLLMNLCAPLIDRYTQPPVFGMKEKRKPDGRG